MKTKISPYKTGNRTVLVTFEHEGIKHARRVPASFKEDGSYDAEATKDTVEQVAAGVANKIAVGVITKDTPDATPEEKDAQPQSA